MTVEIASSVCTLFCVDNDPIICSALRRFVEGKPELNFIGCAAGPAQAIDLMLALKPDVAILDLMYPHDTGLALLGSMRLHVPRTKAIVFSSLAGASIAKKCIQLGAAGFISKHDDVEALIDAIGRVARGELALSPAIADQLLKGYAHADADEYEPLDRLSAIELAVYLMMGQSMSTHEIARCLFKSPKTVETYKRRARQKLGLPSAVAMTQSATEYVADV